MKVRENLYYWAWNSEFHSKKIFKIYIDSYRYSNRYISKSFTSFYLSLYCLVSTPAWAETVSCDSDTLWWHYRRGLQLVLWYAETLETEYKHINRYEYKTSNSSVIISSLLICNALAKSKNNSFWRPGKVISVI